MSMMLFLVDGPNYYVLTPGNGMLPCMITEAFIEISKVAGSMCLFDSKIGNYTQVKRRWRCDAICNIVAVLTTAADIFDSLL